MKAMMGLLALLFVAAPALASAEVFVSVRGDTTIVVAVAAWRPSDQVLIVSDDGSDRLYAAHRVLKIVDSTGTDRTRFVVEGRGLVGAYPETYKGSRKAGSVAVRPLLLGAAGLVMFAGAVALLFVVGGRHSIQ
jgi:hypothetical protein